MPHRRPKNVAWKPLELDWSKVNTSRAPANAKDDEDDQHGYDSDSVCEAGWLDAAEAWEQSQTTKRRRDRQTNKKRHNATRTSKTRQLGPGRKPVSKRRMRRMSRKSADVRRFQSPYSGNEMWYDPWMVWWPGWYDDDFEEQHWYDRLSRNIQVELFYSPAKEERRSMESDCALCCAPFAGLERVVHARWAPAVPDSTNASSPSSSAGTIQVPSVRQGPHWSADDHGLYCDLSFAQVVTLPARRPITIFAGEVHRTNLDGVTCICVSCWTQYLTGLDGISVYNTRVPDPLHTGSHMSPWGEPIGYLREEAVLQWMRLHLAHMATQIQPLMRAHPTGISPLKDTSVPIAVLGNKDSEPWIEWRKRWQTLWSRQQQLWQCVVVRDTFFKDNGNAFWRTRRGTAFTSEKDDQVKFLTCPECTMPMLIDVQGSQCSCVTCSLCDKSFCFNCREDYHYGLSCDAYVAKTPSLQCLRELSQPCPQCGTPIEKNDGCMHMQCTRCRHNFWWDEAVESGTKTGKFGLADVPGYLTADGEFVWNDNTTTTASSSSSSCLQDQNDDASSSGLAMVTASRVVVSSVVLMSAAAAVAAAAAMANVPWLTIDAIV